MLNKVMLPWLAEVSRRETSACRERLCKSLELKSVVITMSSERKQL